jgi:hypothetical protein
MPRVGCLPIRHGAGRFAGTCGVPAEVEEAEEKVLRIQFAPEVEAVAVEVTRSSLFHFLSEAKPTHGPTGRELSEELGKVQILRMVEMAEDT